MNEIVKIQNQPRMQNLLKALILTYQQAKSYHALTLIFLAVLPVAGVVISHFYPSTKPFIAIVALGFGVADIAFFDRWHKALLKKAATLQEEFDCTVLDIPWNEFLVGTKVDHEEVHALASQPLSNKDRSRLKDWYSTHVSDLLPDLARVVCQRTNLWYDGELRGKYRTLLLSILSLLVVVCIIYSISQHQIMEEFILTVLIPLAPLINWTLRENARQGNSIENLKKLKREAEKYAEGMVSTPNPTKAITQSRALQDAIFQHRASSSPIYDWLYFLNRNDLEASMNSGIQHRAEALNQIENKVVP